jgi:F-type H+-transporting ATPase subunit gamma
MKMVSAAKLRRAQGAIVQMRPYSNKLNEMLSNILSNTDGDEATGFGQERDVQRVLLVVVTSNRGLCGAFNTNVIKAAVRHIQQYHQVRASGQLTLLCIGKKGYDYFRKRYADVQIIADYVDLFSELSFERAAPIAERLMSGFEARQYDSVAIAYGRFRNAAMQEPVVEAFLPVPKRRAGDAGVPKTKADFIFEPNQGQLLQHLIPSILKTQFYKTLLDTHASEHGARMTAMDKASENAEELLKELRINYNKARQEAITKELSEIVGGAAALQG